MKDTPVSRVNLAGRLLFNRGATPIRVRVVDGKLYGYAHRRGWVLEIAVCWPDDDAQKLLYRTFNRTRLANCVQFDPWWGVVQIALRSGAALPRIRSTRQMEIHQAA